LIKDRHGWTKELQTDRVVAKLLLNLSWSLKETRITNEGSPMHFSPLYQLPPPINKCKWS